MTFREIQVRVNEDGTKEVDFWPGMYVKPSYEHEPTRNNPEITADLGVVGGKLSPIKSYYPKDYDIDNIIESADSIENRSSLFSKTEHCPMCERKKRAIVQRLRSALKVGGTNEDRVRSLVEEGNRIKSELKKDGYEMDTADPEPYPVAPIPPPPIIQEPIQEDIIEEPVEPVPQAPPPIQVEAEPVYEPEIPIEPEPEPEPVQLTPMEQGQETVANVNTALSDIHNTILMLINTPDQIILPE